MLKRITTFALASLVFTGIGCTDAGPGGAGGKNTLSDRIPISDTVVGGFVLRLTSPQEGQVLKSPFLVGGEARVPSGAVYIRVKNPAGEVVISEQTRIKAEPES